jgi:acryloyl-coenzyme A reductase
MSGLPQTMRAIVMDRPGAPSGLRLADVAVPDLCPCDVLIAVSACGVCFHDVVARNGTFRRGVAMPVILGHEVAGTVVAVGPEVRQFRSGDRVCTTPNRHICGHCPMCRSGRETSCPERIFMGDAGLNGGYAEFVAVSEDCVAALPADVTLDEGAIAACAIGTELNAVRDVAQVRLGERVLVTGAGGGLGIHGVQLARLAGARVVAVTTSPDKVAAIRAAGADEIVLAGKGEDFSGRVRAAIGGGVDVVIDNVGSLVFEATRCSLADGARWVLVGQLTGDFVSLNLAQLFLRDISIRSAKGVSRRQLIDTLALIATGRIKPMITQRLPLADAAVAHEAVEGGASLGRLVLAPGDDRKRP